MDNIIKLVILMLSTSWGVNYEVGPGKTYANIGDVPLENLSAGDSLLIHYRSAPYNEKWVVTAQGTAAKPVVIKGLADPLSGNLPVIDGRNATTRPQLNYWSETRGILKIGGSSIPADQVPSYVIVENLIFTSARPPYSFSDDGGNTDNYSSNAAAIFLESGDNITIRNCTFTDCGNGFFSSHTSTNVLIEKCYYYNNGFEGSIFEHNNYTESQGITFQFNRFGPLRTGCLGNNLKDRSSGCVIRYNWIEGGNRQLDLVDSDYPEFYNHPSYRSTYVYGNILVEPDGAGNSQIVHYGGDSGDLTRYRKGRLHFYHNTVISTRSGNTTLLRLSSNEESADVRNNILFVSGAGNSLGIVDSEGRAVLSHNWIKTGWRGSHGNSSTSVVDSTGNVIGDNPGFMSLNTQNFYLDANSTCRSAGTLLHSAVAINFPALYEYNPHQNQSNRLQDAIPDIGAFEYGSSLPIGTRVLKNHIPNGELKFRDVMGRKIGQTLYPILKLPNKILK